MRLIKEKILKIWNETQDGGCFIDPSHTNGLAPYNMDNMFADDRAKRFTGLVNGLIAKNNWIPLGEESSQTLTRKIRDAKTSPRTYAIMRIDGVSYDSRILFDYLKHYQRASDVIHFFKMTNVKVDAPIVITTNEEWYFIVAPRVAPEGQKNTDAVLFNPPADIWDDTPPPMNDAPMTFNPITGDFE
jgi:hypothetical protein